MRDDMAEEKDSYSLGKNYLEKTGLVVLNKSNY